MNRRGAGDEIRHAASGNAALRRGGLGGWLIRQAAQTAPPELAQRLEEEWLADLAAKASTLARMRFALGCLWATRVIARDHGIATLAAGAPAVVIRTMPAVVWHHRHLFSSRGAAFGLVALLHVAVFYAFLTGLSTSFTKTTAPPLQNRTLEETRARELTPLPPPNLHRVKLDLPVLDANVPIAEDSTQEIIPAGDPAKSTPPANVPPPGVPQHVTTRLQGGPGAGFPTPDDYYPLLAKHREEQGVATVRVCVDAHGRLTGDPTLAEASGSARLDEGALKLARAGSGHYRATTEDGRAVNSCDPFRVRFQLKN